MSSTRSSNCYSLERSILKLRCITLGKVVGCLLEVSQCSRTFMKFPCSNFTSSEIHIFSTLRGHLPLRAGSFKPYSQETCIQNKMVSSNLWSDVEHSSWSDIHVSQRVLWKICIWSLVRSSVLSLESFRSLLLKLVCDQKHWHLLGAC